MVFANQGALLAPHGSQIKGTVGGLSPSTDYQGAGNILAANMKGQTKQKQKQKLVTFC